MKSKPVLRIVFALLFTVGSLLFLQGARLVSQENSNFQAKLNAASKDNPVQQTSTDFIFFESVTKYLVISLFR